jgi:hypothetical protein
MVNDVYCLINVSLVSISFIKIVQNATIASERLQKLKPMPIASNLNETTDLRFCQKIVPTL